MNSSSDLPGPGLKPPRFGLRTMLLGIAVCGAMSALYLYLGMYAAVIAVFAAFCVVAHVAGNALGTKLREIGDMPPPAGGDMPRGRRMYGVVPTDFAPATHLSEKHALSRRVTGITASGAVMGGLLGGCGLAWLIGAATTWLVLVLGAMACGVLAGIATFIASGFFQVSYSAWSQASREPRRPTDSP